MILRSCQDILRAQAAATRESQLLICPLVVARSTCFYRSVLDAQPLIEPCHESSSSDSTICGPTPSYAASNWMQLFAWLSQAMRTSSLLLIGRIRSDRSSSDGLWLSRGHPVRQGHVSTCCLVGSTSGTANPRSACRPGIKRPL